MSRLLIDEPPIAVTPSLIRTLGGHDLACFAQQVWYVAEGPDGIQHDGYRWARRTIEQWCDAVVLSAAQAKRVVATLTELGVLVRCQLPGYDRTAASRIDVDALERIRSDRADASGRNQPDEAGGKQPDRTGAKQPDVPPTEKGRSPRRAKAASAQAQTLDGLDAPAETERTNGQIAHEMMTRFWTWVERETGHPPLSIRPVAIVKMLTHFLDANVTRDALSCALRELHRAGRPLTQATIEAQLDGRRPQRSNGRRSVDDQLSGLRYDAAGNLLVEQ